MSSYYNPAHAREVFAIELRKQLTKLDPLFDYDFWKDTVGPVGSGQLFIKVTDKEKNNNYFKNEMITLIVRDDGVQFGRTLDGYILLYTEQLNDPKAVAIGLIKKLRELAQIKEVF